ncbi:hypothetical protein vseg_004873 [Gypsophila vaccaria]
MKSSFGKLKKFAFHKTDAAKDRRDFHHRPPKLDELALASQEMQDMRDCYDSLLSAAAATANSAYEFSESLREMGGCLLDKAELYKDDDSSKRALMMLGKIQLELQKLVDRYRSHIFLTITNPSESLLNQLQTVQEMKQQCDEKRTVYEYIIAQQQEKGRSKGGKGENFSMEQLKQAHTEYEEEATLCVFRLKSLKQGQSRSLLTQAARHHTAQLNFFKRGLKSLEAIDSHVKLIAENQHIDCQLSGLDDNDEGDDEGENSYYSNDHGEVSFDYRPQKLGTDAVATSRNSMELDQEEESIPKPSTTENTEFRFEKVQGDSQMLDSEPRTSNYSHSAPIFAEKKFDPAESIRRMRPSLTQKFHTYVLPTPGDAKSSSSTRTSSAPRARPKSRSEQNIWHSSPIETQINKRDSKEDNQSAAKTYMSLHERDTNQAATRLPPLADGLPSRLSDAVDSSDNKKIKRQAFSGPLSSNPRSTKHSLYASGPISAAELPLLASGPVSQASVPRPSSPKASRRSPPSVSPPKISELHELPRPPGSVSNKPGTSIATSGSIAPLVSKTSEFPVKNKTTFVASSAASPLPIPPLTIPRSLSTPSSHYRAKALNLNKVFESSQLDRDAASPPLTPMSLTNAKTVLTSRAGAHSRVT